MSRNEVFIEEKEIPARITEQHTNDLSKLKHEASTNKEITATEGIPENDYATVNYEELDNIKVVTPTDTTQQFLRLVCF